MAPAQHPYFDRDEVHEIYRSWRAIAECYDPPRVFVAEAWVGRADQVLDFRRGSALRCVVNLSAEPVALPAGRAVLASSPLPGDGTLGPASAVWLARAARPTQ